MRGSMGPTSKLGVADLRKRCVRRMSDDVVVDSAAKSAAKSKAARSLFGGSQDLHLHRVNAAFGKLRQLGEPRLHIRLGIVCLKIRFVGEDFIEDEVAIRLPVFLQEVYNSFWIAPNELDQRQRRNA